MRKLTAEVLAWVGMSIALFGLLWAMLGMWVFSTAERIGRTGVDFNKK